MFYLEDFKRSNNLWVVLILAIYAIKDKGHRTADCLSSKHNLKAGGLWRRHHLLLHWRTAVFPRTFPLCKNKLCPYGRAWRKCLGLNSRWRDPDDSFTHRDWHWWWCPILLDGVEAPLVLYTLDFILIWCHLTACDQHCLLGLGCILGNRLTASRWRQNTHPSPVVTPCPAMSSFGCSEHHWKSLLCLCPKS